jgi:hypothetical protein
MKATIFILLTASLFYGQSITSTSVNGAQRRTLPSGLSSTAIANTSTQAVLIYTAPSSGACQVEASENGDGTYRPLVHDVDPELFAGANSDQRTGELYNGTSRIFVLGRRLSATALDGHVYSRALGALTQHYYRITCGSAVATGTFTTTNIPFGMTHQDAPQPDPGTPGGSLMPTLLDLRSQRIYDPKTGAQIRSVTLPSDIPYDPANPATSGPYSYDAGFVRICGTSLVGPGPGFLCAFPQGDGGPGVLYYIIPSTGETRYLGKAPSAYPYINPIDSKWYLVHNAVDLKQQTYAGDYMAATPGTSASFTTTTIATGIPTLLHAFNSTFTAANYSCGDPLSDVGIGVIGDYAYLICRRGVQDTYGWVSVLQISTGSVIAAMRIDANLQCRWCGVHATYSMYDQGAVAIVPHGFVGASPALGGGPYQSTYAGGSTLATGSTSITVSGNPTCSACGADSDVAPARVGDVFTFRDGTGEQVTITAIGSPTSWSITATTQSHAPGAVLEGTCKSKPLYWKFLADPHGTDGTDTNVVGDVYWPGGGHDDAITGVRLTEHWSVVLGDLLSSINTPLTRTIPESPKFAGAPAQCYGNGCISHPSAGPPGAAYLTDYFKYDGAGADGANYLPITAQVYKYLHSGEYPSWDIKHFDIVGVMSATFRGGPYAFRDVSGVGSVLPTDSSGSYRFCRANAANECVAGSSAGDEYFNAPNSAFYPSLTSGTYAAMVASSSAHGALWTVTDAASPNVCTGGGGSAKAQCRYNVWENTWSPNSCGLTDSGSPCINNLNAYAGNVVQIGTDGAHSRNLTGGLVGPRNTNEYPTAKALADGSYVLFSYGDIAYHKPARMLMVKLPPFTSYDSVDRTTFVRTTISIAPPGGMGIATAVIEFGYDEFGTSTQHYCTSRQEACVAASATVNDAIPFYYATTDTYSRLGCASSCTITVPVLPAHVAYYTVKFYDGSGMFVTNGASGVIAESTVVPLREAKRFPQF